MAQKLTSFTKSFNLMQRKAVQENMILLLMT